MYSNKIDKLKKKTNYFVTQTSLNYSKQTTLHTKLFTVKLTKTVLISMVMLL